MGEGVIIGEGVISEAEVESSLEGEVRWGKARRRLCPVSNPRLRSDLPPQSPPYKGGQTRRMRERFSSPASNRRCHSISDFSIVEPG